ncbi:hypothetical protein [Melittangium boletus]|uniref:hypothetical protein n=1 Tax=Melittangium boletus TaxID=83453 RepID=UPI000BB3DEDB|nr:hypothetical protein [Melittangium boletus]
MPTTVLRAAQVVRGVLTLKDFLDEAEVARVEEVLVRCAREADFQVNEREYGRGRVPDDVECKRVVGHDSKGREILRAMELGTLKHEVAFACVARELGEDFTDHLTREPRYRREPVTGAYSLTQTLSGSLRPDIVLHLVHDADRIQFLYDFFFPCTSGSKSNPLGAENKNLLEKLGKYRLLAEESRRALVTPQLGISR